MNTHELNFTLRLDPKTRDELEALSNAWRCSRAETLRRLVQNANAHFFGTIPTCADGGRCFVPQMHAKKGAA